MNAMEGSPDTGKAQERVTFFTTNLNYTLQIEEEYFRQSGRQTITIPARLIKFEGGHFSTDDARLIGLIRDCKRYRTGKITEERKKEVLAQDTVRGAITSATLREEAGAEKKPEAQMIQEKGISMCDVPGCDFIVRNDFGGRKLQGHKLGAHRKGMRPKKVEEKKNDNDGIKN